MRRYLLALAAVLLIAGLLTVQWPTVPDSGQDVVAGEATDAPHSAQTRVPEQHASPQAAGKVVEEAEVSAVAAPDVEPSLDENHYFAKNSLRLVAANALLAGDNFLDRLAAFERLNADGNDGRRTFAARDVFLAKAAELNSGSYLHGLACGKRLCIGSVGFVDKAENARFMEQLTGRYGETGATRVSLTAAQEEGRNEMRFAISIDSGINSVTVEDGEAERLGLELQTRADVVEKKALNPRE